jgi:hypothetical protein
MQINVKNEPTVEKMTWNAHIINGIQEKILIIHIKKMT